jgi:Sensors of blue-light using FAD
MLDHRQITTKFQAQTQQPDLYAIVYVSTAAKPVALGELIGLIEGARRRNAEEGITGVLLYSDRSFMQYLEGPAGALSRVYEIIKSHHFHYGLIDLIRARIQEREFSDWAMAFHLVDATGRAAPIQQDALLAARLRMTSKPNSAACRLLSEFWSRGRRSVFSALRDVSHARNRRRPRDLCTGTCD